MLTRREVVIEKPFRDRRYKDHRRKVRSALPRIDAGPPPEYPHLMVKLKKLRLERDRQGKICEDNIKLAHRMAIIMRTKRLDNINMAPKGPFERRAKASARRATTSRMPSEEDDWTPGGSFLEQVTSEVERRLKPPPPGKIVQHRAPAGLCRVPRVGPPPQPRSPTARRRHHRVPTITLPLTSPRSRRSPSPTSASERSSARCRRGRETTRLSPLPSLGRRASITASLPSPHDDNSSSAADEDDFDEKSEKSNSENTEEWSDKTLEENEQTDDQRERVNEESEKNGEHSGVGEEGSRTESESPDSSEPFGETDSDDRVSSILLSHHPNITIDEASDDGFYS
ncbi:uncharacterized protein [Panulirus ornatus]